jgi:UDP-N-acetylmuramate--alanine ligase
LANAIRTDGAIDPIVVSDQTQLAKTLIEVLQDQDVLLMQGAGDIGRLAATLSQAERLEVLS